MNHKYSVGQIVKFYTNKEAGVWREGKIFEQVGGKENNNYYIDMMDGILGCAVVHENWIIEVVN